jgi:hypothetical protein
MLTKIELRNIEEEVQQEIQDQIDKAKSKVKKPRKPKGEKDNSGRKVSIDRDLVNTFNAQVAFKGISKQLKGNIEVAKIDIEGITISMTKLPKKNDWDKIRYEVSGGHGQTRSNTKALAIVDLSERTIIETNKAQGIMPK